MRKLRILAPISVLAMLTLVAAPGGAAASQTKVTALQATASGTTINVSGTADFGTQDPVEVMYDGVGDGLIGGGYGLDFESLLVHRASGSSNNLVFTWKLDGLTGGGVPEAFQYNWDIAVDGGAEAGGSNWSIKSMRSGQATNPGQTNGWAALYRCVQDGSPTGGFTCSSLAALGVVYDQSAGEIRITVPLSRIQADGGSKIDAWARNGQPAWIRTSAAGATTGFVTVDDGFHDTYTVPSNTVQLGIASPGTPPSLVSFSKSASVSGSNFAGQLNAPGSGSYEVYAKACYGPSNCAVSSKVVTV